MNSDNKAVNLLTFDIEDWFHANYCHIDPEQCRAQGSNFRQNMEQLLELCHDTGSKATFFVLGSIGEDYPEVVKDIVNAGHDVASHGYGHQLAYEQTIDEFREDVRTSIGILEDITGQKVRGYRAPSWSIVERNFHYLEVLEELGLQYDASVFPVKTFLYGIPEAPTHIHRPSVNGRTLNLYEIPMSVMKLGQHNMGYSGGFYFRFFPGWLIKRIIRRANRHGKNAIVYLHPREIDPAEQRLDLPAKEAFIHYYNVKRTKAKLTDIMSSFTFTSISDYLNDMEIKR